MLSPATFIGIAKAATPTGQATPARATPPLATPARPVQNAVASGPSAVGAAATGSVQRARVQATQPLGAIATTPNIAKPPATASPNPSAAAPRNLPRGSLLDLSV